MSECDCEECGEPCEDCGTSTAPEELDRGEEAHGVRCCEDCADIRDEEDECQCPGGEELGRCCCPACSGGR